MPARIQFQHIRYFLALAAEGSFTRAAKCCGISQPSLTNAIKALELALGGRLFERGLNGCRLTPFGLSLRPHFQRVQRDVEQIDRIAAREPAVRDSSARRRRLSTITAAIAAMLASLAVAMPDPARAGGAEVEAAIREALPGPVRCGRTGEPLFTCRHEHPPEHSMVLDLSSGRDGPSASLTYNYDDARHRRLLDVMRGFFGGLGIPASVFDACLAQSEWVPLPVSGRAATLTCYRVELGDRVTYEVFATPPGETPIRAGAER